MRGGGMKSCTSPTPSGIRKRVMRIRSRPGFSAGSGSSAGALRWARGAGGRVGRRGLPAERSAGGGWERFETCERGGELGDPWPGALEVELRLAAVERELGGDVQEPVAQPLG